MATVVCVFYFVETRMEKSLDFGAWRAGGWLPWIVTLFETHCLLLHVDELFVFLQF